jgi:transcriptional regulator with XRE-family HTH domain
MIPLISELASLRRAAGIEQQHIAAALGLGAKAGPSAVSAWESGQQIPTVGHTCGFARLVGRRVVVVRAGVVVGDLLDVLPRFSALLPAAGSGTRLATVLRHLGAGGHELVLAPVPPDTAALSFPTGGACAGRADLMNPAPGDAQALEVAVETCLSCPAYGSCLAWITATPPDDDPGGVIAALTETERAVVTRPAPATARRYDARLRRAAA